jgi:hypothetical protein
MKSLSTTLRVLACAIFIAAISSAAQAQATRTWVSGVGDDANPCSRTAPCKTFAGAISKTAAGGEIDALDPGGYGAVTITKAITIDGGYTLASILASGTNGVIVNIAVGATDGRRVTLRRLSINGAGTPLGLNGVRILAAREVHVENCYIQNFSTTGIKCDELAESGTLLRVVDTNINNTVVGITAGTTTTFMLAVIDRVHISRMQAGIISKDRAFMTVRDSFISDSKLGAAPLPAGIQVLAPSNINNLNVERTVFFSVGKGVIAGANGTKVSLSNSSFLNNGDAFTTGGGQVSTHGNNQFANNTNAVPAMNPLGQQ